MAKINLQNIGSGFQSRELLNNNFLAIQQAFNNTLSRDGEHPNNMQANIDMNLNDIINVRLISTDNLQYRGVDLTENLEIFLNNYETIIDDIQVVIDARVSVEQALLSISQMHDDVEGIESDIKDIEQAIILLSVQTEAYKELAEIAASTSTGLVPLFQNGIAALESIAASIGDAQAQANAIIGLGIGLSYVDQDGHLIMSYHDGYFDSLEITNDGHLVLEWTV